MSDDDLARVFASLDADGSGVLELSEFLNAIHAEPPAEEASAAPTRHREAAASAVRDRSGRARGEILGG